MPFPTIVEDYIVAAMRRAVPETQRDGIVGAYIPEFPGLVAFGADVHECARVLYGCLDEWIHTSLVQGYPLPALDGVDLGADAESALASYSRRSRDTGGQGAFFEDEAALEEAFRHFDEVAGLASQRSA